MAKCTRFVGLDVHAETIVAAPQTLRGVAQEAAVTLRATRTWVGRWSKPPGTTDIDRD